MDQAFNVIHTRATPWIGLCCILVLYILAVFQYHPPDLFGRTQDDSLYFASAKALANHQGYILPSVPGQPLATKYPILFPWVLSWVWRWNPSFPSNLTEAVGVVVAFGVAFIVCCFLYLRRLKGIGDLAAIMLTFFIALHPVLLFYSANVLSDVPFTALAVAAMLLADEAMRPGAKSPITAACAVLTGLSILMRSFGVPIAAGILAAALARRAWRQIIIFCAVLVPFGLESVARWFQAPPMMTPVPGAAPLGPGFARTWTYYTSYLGFWKLSVPNAHIFWAMLKNNAVVVFLSPSDFFLAPLLKSNHLLSSFLMLIVTFGIFSGLVRQWKDSPWNSIHCAFLFYASLTLIWNYPNTSRFFFLFLPVFAGALWDETKHFLKLLYATATNNSTRSQKALAGLFAFGVFALLCGGIANYVRGAREMMKEIIVDRSHLLGEKREAYNWLSCCTSREDRVVAYEDVTLYLYSGRQGMRPVVFPTSGEFDEQYTREALEQMTDVAHAIGARYWLVASDDFSLEWDIAASMGLAKEMELTRDLPVAFQSPGGHIRIYNIGCEGRPDAGPCP